MDIVSERVIVVLLLETYVLSLRTYLSTQRGGGWDLAYRLIPPQLCPCPKPGYELPSTYVVIFSMFNNLRKDVFLSLYFARQNE
jgi:hypothetical protein